MERNDEHSLPGYKEVTEKTTLLGMGSAVPM